MRQWEITLSRELSKRYDIPYYEIDNIIWDRSAGNLKFPDDIRNNTFKEIIDKKCWIIEGVQSKDWTIESFSQSDFIIILNPNVFTRSTYERNEYISK